MTERQKNRKFDWLTPKEAFGGNIEDITIAEFKEAVENLEKIYGSDGILNIYQINEYEIEVEIIYDALETDEEFSTRLMEEKRQELRGKIEYRENKIKKLKKELSNAKNAIKFGASPEKVKSKSKEIEAQIKQYEDELVEFWKEIEKAGEINE